jgi:N-glycosylase/DNA lyase
MKISQHFISVRDYDLASTLSSGQAFRWKQNDAAWEGVIGSHWIRLTQTPDGILAETAERISDWKWLHDYLQSHVDIQSVLLSFPNDETMRLAVAHSRGLRLLRQDPWECLASFILSSTKQIVQIQQIVGLLCERFGNQLVVPQGRTPVYSFPTANRLAACSETNLRDCKMGFRAPNLLKTAKIVSEGRLDLSSLYSLSVEEARAKLVELPGVGRKIADCVLLFAYGIQEAFPIDVWILKALRELYFPKRKPTKQRLEKFSQTYFGSYAGYAQQYLFHYMRTKPELALPKSAGPKRRSVRNKI